MLLAFIIWEFMGACFVALGIYTLFSKKVTRYWANVSKKIEVTDVKKYNRAAGTLWIIFAVIFCLLGLPFLIGQNAPWAILSCIGAMFDSIFIMAGLSMTEGKYEKRS